MSNHKIDHNNNKPLHKRKWLALTVVGAALLLIPRRSSRQANYADTNANNTADDNNSIKKNLNQ